jgi:hypothetical protein
MPFHIFAQVKGDALITVKNIPFFSQATFDFAFIIDIDQRLKEEFT